MFNMVSRHLLNLRVQNALDYISDNFNLKNFRGLACARNSLEKCVVRSPDGRYRPHIIRPPLSQNPTPAPVVVVRLVPSSSFHNPFIIRSCEGGRSCLTNQFDRRRQDWQVPWGCRASFSPPRSRRRGKGGSALGVTFAVHCWTDNQNMNITEVKHHVYVKRQTRICTTWPSFPLLVVHFSLFLHIR